LLQIYTAREDCTQHGGPWKFVFDEINNGGGTSDGGGSTVVVGPGGITLTPVVNPGEVRT
jgi:hypothetical protein